MSLPSTMKTAFIRIAEKNEVHELSDYHNYKVGDVVDYTLNEIVAILDDWAQSKKLTYYVIHHDADIDIDVGHFHVVLDFKGIATKGDLVKRKFPFGDIQTCRNLMRAVQYLVHLNNIDKIQYEWDEITHNDNKGLERFKVKSKGNNFDEIIRKIGAGEIKEYEIGNYIDAVTYSKKKRQIDYAINYALMKQANNPERDYKNRIRTIVIQGETRTGKTDLAKAYCKFLGIEFCISGSSNDPWEHYKGQDCMILDDLRDDAFKLSTLIKMFDPFNSTPIHRRYHNAVFSGNYIIVTTNKKIWNFYSGVGDEESRKALFARFELIIDMENISGETIFRLIKYNKDENRFERDLKEYKFVPFRNFDKHVMKIIEFSHQNNNLFQGIEYFFFLMHEDNAGFYYERDYNLSFKEFIDDIALKYRDYIENKPIEILRIIMGKEEWINLNAKIVSKQVNENDEVNNELNQISKDIVNKESNDSDNLFEDNIADTSIF